MIQIDPGGVMATIITVMLSIIGLASWLGALSQKVKGHDRTIDKLHAENRQDHQLIYGELKALNRYLRNGKSPE
jgi:hypothetical protein